MKVAGCNLIFIYFPNSLIGQSYSLKAKLAIPENSEVMMGRQSGIDEPEIEVLFDGLLFRRMVLGESSW
jgi:hypothetical protein